MKAILLPFVAFAFIAPPSEPKASPAKPPKYEGSAQVSLKDIPPTLPAVRVTVSTLPELTENAMWFWDYDDEDATVVKESPNQLILDVAATPERVLKIRWVAKEPNTRQVTVRKSVKVGHGPQPPPTPPGPVPPTPTTGMIDAPGFHVLIKYNRDDFGRPASETSILSSESVTSVRQYLKSACPTVADGQGWRMYPVPAEGVTAPWKAPYERSQGALPTMTVSKNGKGWEGSIKDWTPEQVIAKCKEIEALP